MSAPPYVPLFAADYLADTTALSCEEHGAYFLLLLTAWQQPDCDLPDDDRKLARICRLSLRKWRALRPTIEDFWQVSDGRWTNPRLTRERAYADKKSESNRQNARKRWGAQDIENKQHDQCERICDGNAPQPQPHSDTVEDKSSTAADAAKSSPVSADDIAKALFDSGIAVLARIGVREPQARSIVGKWRKQYRDSEVLAVLAQAQRRTDLSEPLEWITTALRNERQRSTGAQTNGQPHRPERASVSEIGQRIASRAAGHG